MVASSSKTRLSDGPEVCLTPLLFAAKHAGRFLVHRANCKDTQDLITPSPQTLKEGELQQGRLLSHSLKRHEHFWRAVQVSEVLH